MINILGIDPGLMRLGWGSVILEGDEIELGHSGLISSPRDTAISYNNYLDESIGRIADELPVIFSIVLPQAMFIEFVPPGKLGSRSETTLASASVAKTIAYQWGIPWYGIAASTWKKELTGDDKATKAVIRNTVLDAFPSLARKHEEAKELQRRAGEKKLGIPQDVFDSIGIAIAGASIYNVIEIEREAQDSTGSL